MIYRKGFGWANAEWKIPNTPDAKFRIGSITKQFTAMLVMQLVEAGKLRLDGTIGDYLPEYPPGPGRAITIHQLLTHTSGLHSYTALPRFFSDLSRDPLQSLAAAVALRFPAPRSPAGHLLALQQFGVHHPRRDHRTGRREAVRCRPPGAHPGTPRPQGTGYDWTATVLGNRAEGYRRGYDGDETDTAGRMPGWTVAPAGTA